MLESATDGAMDGGATDDCLGRRLDERCEGVSEGAGEGASAERDGRGREKGVPLPLGRDGVVVNMVVGCLPAVTVTAVGGGLLLPSFLIR